MQLRFEQAVTRFKSNALGRKWLVGALAAALVACGGGGGGSTSSRTGAPNTFVVNSVQEALDRAIALDVDGIWVFVDDGVNPPEFLAAGIQDRATSAPADVSNLFKIASISKMFVAVSGAKMAAAGTLDLDDTLAHWLPDLATRIGVLTLRQRAGGRDRAAIRRPVAPRITMPMTWVSIET